MAVNSKKQGQGQTGKKGDDAKVKANKEKTTPVEKASAAKSKTTKK